MPDFDRVPVLSMQELIDLIRIFATDPDYEIRPDHVHDQLHKVRHQRKQPRSRERKDMRPGRPGARQTGG